MSYTFNNFESIDTYDPNHINQMPWSLTDHLFYTGAPRYTLESRIRDYVYHLKSSLSVFLCKFNEAFDVNDALVKDLKEFYNLLDDDVIVPFGISRFKKILSESINQDLKNFFREEVRIGIGILSSAITPGDFFNQNHSSLLSYHFGSFPNAQSFERFIKESFAPYNITFVNLVFLYLFYEEQFYSPLFDAKGNEIALVQTMIRSPLEPRVLLSKPKVNPTLPLDKTPPEEPFMRYVSAYEIKYKKKFDTFMKKVRELDSKHLEHDIKLRLNVSRKIIDDTTTKYKDAVSSVQTKEYVNPYTWT